jgi:putative PIN family toxin of toxin-antitoxin system
MRVVLDTNLLIAALISDKGPPKHLYEAWPNSRFTLVTSTWQIAEFRRVSRYNRVRPYITPSEAGKLVNGLREHAEVLEALPQLELSPDPDDDRVLAIAAAGKADYLVTGDKKDLLPLEKIPGTRILKARAFLNEMLRG